MKTFGVSLRAIGFAERKLGGTVWATSGWDRGREVGWNSRFKCEVAMFLRLEIWVGNTFVFLVVDLIGGIADPAKPFEIEG